MIYLKLLKFYLIYIFCEDVSNSGIEWKGGHFIHGVGRLTLCSIVLQERNTKTLVMNSVGMIPNNVRDFLYVQCVRVMCRYQ